MVMAYDKWYKFYIVEMSNKHYPTPEGYVFVKFGITHHMNIMDRFNPLVNDGYEKNYEDWNIVPKFSIACESKARAEQIEKYYHHTKYPYNSHYKVWVEKVIGIPDNDTKYSKSTGITELRYMPIPEAKKLYQSLNKHKKTMEKPFVTN